MHFVSVKVFTARDFGFAGFNYSLVQQYQFSLLLLSVYIDNANVNIFMKFIMATMHARNSCYV